MKVGDVTALGSVEDASWDSDKPSQMQKGGNFKMAHDAMSSGDLLVGGASETEHENLVALTQRPLSLHGWSDGMLRQILHARTSFSFFVRRCLHCCKGVRLAPNDALFPLPLPHGDCWAAGLEHLGADRRARLAVRKCLFLVVAGLNFMHYVEPLSALQDIRRLPSACHLSVYRRLTALMRACGPDEVFSIFSCGRKSFQLDARLRGLLLSLQSLGLSNASRYDQSGSGAEVEVLVDREELRPYRPLDASRIKLTGEGAWDCRPYLSDLLYLPFVEPRVNQFAITPPDDVLPDLTSTKKEEVIKLAKVWDAKNLLRIFPRQCGPEHRWGLCKVFNNFKNQSSDRQIGDRRGLNYVEGVLGGPSRSLPTSADLLQVCPKRFEQCLSASITDRRDFYHQFYVTDEKATCNAMYPVVTARDLCCTKAFELYHQEFVDGRKRRMRETEGDFLHGAPRPMVAGMDEEVIISFGALFQGDHLGVEVACDSHANLLESNGLLPWQSRLSSASHILRDEVTCGLVIDDFFVVSKEPQSFRAGSGSSQSEELFGQAKKVYQSQQILGSDDKDIVGQRCFKICGGEVDSSEESVSRGVVALGAPYGKRMALAMLSAGVASLPYTDDALHSTLVGSWISVLLLRRPAMSILDEVFKVIPPLELQPDRPLLRPLSRRAAAELQVLAVLAPVLVSNLAVPFSGQLYATDASLAKGGIVEAEIDDEMSSLLWRSAARKGPNVPVLRKGQAVLNLYDMMFEEVPADEDGAKREALFEEERPQRPIGLRFQFIEVCGGSGVVTKELIKLGIICGPVLELSISKQYDVTNSRVLEWVAFLLEEDRLDGFLVAPPCTTFSPAAHPCCRSYTEPRGFLPLSDKARLGNILAFAALFLVMIALRMKKFGLLEQPRRSKMRRLGEWQRLIALGAEEAWLASCAYGSPHQKEFVLLGANMKVQLLHKKCSRDHVHIPIAGRFTKPSAVYTPGLAKALAIFFKDHFCALSSASRRLSLNADGLEDLLTNELCGSLRWKFTSSWRWKSPSHINVLELGSVLKMMRIVAEDGGDRRQPFFVDSHVVRSCLARGRSSADSLKLLLRKVGAVSIAFGIYAAGRFAPTRLNPGDCPTRDLQIPAPTPHSLLGGDSESRAFGLSLIKGLRRWSANWARLTLLLCPSILDFALCSYVRKHPLVPISPDEWTLDFDSTLGYPGEGPTSLGLRVIWGFLLLLNCCQVVLAVWVSHGDEGRKAARAGIILEDGRRVTQTTAEIREELVQKFISWLGENDLSFDGIFIANQPDVDKANKVLVAYGRWLFSEGRPYYHYSETINAVTSRRPLLRRSLQQAWDLAFMWGSYEPAEHHVAMPFQVIIALISSAWFWGWQREAAVFALTWGALLRTGELLASRRADLILPSDVDFTIDYALVKISEPKTRYRAARHQAAKLEHVDLLEVVRIGFESLRADEKLWPQSGSTLRSRLSRLLERLGLPNGTHSVPKPMTMASLRPGGATFLMNCCESAELVRRRGRWASFRVMEIYLQEVAASTYLNQISGQAKANVLMGLRIFPILLAKVRHFYRCKIPATTWYFLLSQEV